MTRSSDIADVSIVGAGASGGVLSRFLEEAGSEVVCLEWGDWPAAPTTAALRTTGRRPSQAVVRRVEH